MGTALQTARCLAAECPRQVGMVGVLLGRQMTGTGPGTSVRGQAAHSEPGADKLNRAQVPDPRIQTADRVTPWRTLGGSLASRFTCTHTHTHLLQPIQREVRREETEQRQPGCHACLSGGGVLSH